MDITDKSQIQALVDQIEKDEGGVDVLINNAGVNLDDNYNLETATQTLETNYKGTLEVSPSIDHALAGTHYPTRVSTNHKRLCPFHQMCQSFLPLLKERKGSRIVNLSSVASQLNHYSPEIQERFRKTSTLDEVKTMADEYLVRLSVVSVVSVI